MVPEGPKINIATFLQNRFQIVEPNERVTDTIHFVFNNVSTSTMDQKVKDLKAVLKDDLYDYLSHHMVVRRVSQEDTFHEVCQNNLEQN